MWFCLNNAFLSIVQHKDDPDSLLVRARRWEDLKNAFNPADHEILVTPEADYPYRIVIPRWEAQAWAYFLTNSIDYPNFKASVRGDDEDRAAFYHRVWRAGRDFQRGAPIHPQVPPPDGRQPISISSALFSTPPEIRPAARMDSWQHQPMRRPRFLAYEDAFNPAEWRRLERGLIPDQMEEKWFVYVDDEWIHFHRSWTGFELYRARHVERGGMRVIIGVEHETDPDIYEPGGPDYERGVVRWLTRRLLLIQPWVRFPTYPHAPDRTGAVLAQYQMGGSAAFWQAMMDDGDTAPPHEPMVHLAARQGQIEEFASDTIVCPTKVGLGSGGAIFQAVHAKAGPRLLEATTRLWGCPLGEARISEGFDLPARYVIHLPLPRWKDGQHGEHVLLSTCYRAAFDTAARQGLRSIAIPALGTGGHGFPLEEVVRIAFREARAALDRRSSLREIVFVCYDAETTNGFRERLGGEGG